MVDLRRIRSSRLFSFEGYALAQFTDSNSPCLPKCSAISYLLPSGNEHGFRESDVDDSQFKDMRVTSNEGLMPHLQALAFKSLCPPI